MENNSHIEVYLSYARRLINEGEQSRQRVTDALARTRASSDLASAAALVALAERLKLTNDHLQTIADESGALKLAVRDLKGAVSSIEARLGGVETSVSGVGAKVENLASRVHSLQATVDKASKDGGK